MKFVTTLRKISEEEFKEEEHPRDTGGKFTSKGGGVSKKTKISKDKKTDNADRIENVKNDHFISRMLKAGVQPNEMDLQLAELDKKKDELRDIKTKRTFKHDFGDGQGELELTGTPEFEKVWKEYNELSDEVRKKEEDEYRKSYGWKEGDPFRWTPHNDDPDTADTSGDYGSNYTYKHLTEEESDVIMRRWWNDSMTRKEREKKYDYIHGSYINYLNEDEKTPEDLREDLGEDQSIPSDYFFFTDKKTNKQFRGFGMTKAEIKKRAKHGIGSYHEDNSYVGRPDRDVIVYDRPLDYPKFHSKRVSAYNFGEKGSRTDKLWDDLDDDERGRIEQDYKFDGEFYIGWQEEQEKLFYDWKSRQGNTGGDKVNGKHNELYSEYGISEKTDSLNNVTLTDDDRLDYAHKLYKAEYIEKHSDEELIDIIKKRDDRWALKDKKRGIMKKISRQTYFQQGVIERQKYVGVLFNGLSAYDKDMLAGNAFDYEAPNNPTEDDELRWEDLTDDEHMDIRKVVEDEADEDSPRYDIEETFQKLQPKKAIGFDYEKGIPEPQNVDILRNWSDRMHPIAYVGGIEKETKEVIIPQYPKAKQRTVKEHENQIKQLNSTLKKETEKHKPTDKEYWGWEENVIAHDVEEFREYVRKNESKLNLDLHMYKRMWDKDDWLYGTHLPKNEKEWRKHFIDRALGVGDSKVASKVHQLRHFTSLIKQNPKLAEKYQHILDKTDKLNHDNYDLFLKTPEFYRGTRTFELDHYLENKNTGDMWDWSEKHYPFTALGMDKSTAQSPSEQRIDWEMKDGELSGGKVVITYEGDSVRELGVPVQYNTQSTVNNQGADASEIIGMPYNMVAYAEREVRVNPNSKIPKIKEINFGINMGKYKDQKILPVRQRKMLLKKYLPLVGGDKSKIKFYKFVEHALESGYEVYAVEEFVEDEHPRDEDGKFTDKDGSNARVERQKSILQQEIDYLKKSIKEESKKYRPFEKVSDEDRAIRWVNKSVVAQIKELEEELNSTDTVGLPYIPLKPNTHEIETIDNGMYLANSDSEPEYESEREAMKSWSGMKLGLHPLEGFKKGNSTIKVSLDIKEKSDSGIYREVAEKQINLARIMWNSLSDEERDSIHNLTIEKRPSIKTIKNEKGEVVLDPKSFHEASVVGSWAFNTNELTIRIDPSLKPEMIKGTFIHEVGHSMYHEIKEKHPERIKKWKEMVEKIPPTTKYGKYNRSNWKDSEKMLKELDARNWEWKEVVARDSDGNPIRIGEWKDEVKMIKEPIPKEDVEKLRSNTLSNIAFYKDLYFNEIHSEVHMYMMGQQKRGHMKKTGKATKGITKFVDAYRLLHDLPKMEEPLVVGEAEEDSPVMGVEDITEPIGEVVIYLDENFERVLDEDEGEYEFVIELNNDMTIKRYSIRSMWEETATEEFREEDHPREEDGKFTDKDGGGSNKKGLVKSIRDITYDMMIKERQRKLENAMTLKDPDKKLAKVYKEQIEKIEKLRDSNEYRLQGLHGVEFTSTKKNTHTKNKDGFKTNKTEIRIGDTVRVGKSPHDGQPHPMVQARMDLIVEAIRNVWNAIPDEYRDGIHILQIHNVRGLSGTTLGKFSSNRKGTVKTLTMRIQQSDSKHIDTLIHTLLHEIAHSIWHNKFQYDEEKVNKFRDGINKLIKESGAITDYVQNDHVDLERLNEIYWDHRGGVGDKHAYASAFLDSEDMSGEEATRYVAYQKKQIETIVANETHSEAFGFLLGGIDKWGPSKKLRENPEMVQEYFKLVKELHDD